MIQQRTMILDRGDVILAKKTINPESRRRNYLVTVFILLSFLTSTCVESTSLSSKNIGAQIDNVPPADESAGLLQRISGDQASLTPSTTEQTASETGPPLPQESGGDNKASVEAIGSLVFIATTVSLCIIAFFAFVGGAYCWYKNNNLARLAEKTDYPAYGVTGPNPLHYAPDRPPIDSNLNRHAEVYHYQQQKQKLKALSSASSESSARSRQSTSETLNDPATETNDDDEENSDGEYTVYECPGLASTTDGPLEIHNPLFADSETFASYGTPPLGGGIVSSKFTYPTSVGNRG